MFSFAEVILVALAMVLIVEGIGPMLFAPFSATNITAAD
jgi:uncharacterized protein YjeT (DUF2065 family)